MKYRGVILVAGAVMLLAVSCGKTETTTTETPLTNNGANNQSTPPPANNNADQAKKTFNISGTNFKFSSSEIRVKKGDTVTINYTTTSGLHDWVVDEFAGARTKELGPNQSQTITFIASKNGTFEYYCSVGNHRQQGMVGKLIVE